MHHIIVIHVSRIASKRSHVLVWCIFVYVHVCIVLETFQNGKENWRSGSPDSPGQCSCTQVCGCNGFCAWLWLWTGWSPSIFSWFGTIYFLFQNMKKHLAGKQYPTDEEVILSAVENFSEVRMRASCTTGNPSAATPMREEVCGPQEIMVQNKLHLVKFDHNIAP